MALTQAQVAAILGVTARRIRQMHQEGKGPTQNADGQYDEELFGQWLRAQAADTSGGYNYEAERARLTHEQANKTALENSELRADLVRMTVVESYWASLGAACRAKLVSVPSKLGTLVADASARVKFIGQAEALIYDALAEIQSDAVPHDVRARAARSRRDDVSAIVPTAAEANPEPVG